ncbi:hypothetical protein P9139_02650 [Curtobacterium flaccumfaciens]|nr:hypothetical protein P9139_02650 [Curtobacterium flaccumfaciens]
MLDGEVVPALLDLVAPEDVLVIGTHKTGHLYGRSLGTTGLALATAAPCTVVVVPDMDLRFRRGVVAGIDTRPDAVVVSEAAAAEAERRGDELVLIRAGGPDREGTDRSRSRGAGCRTRTRVFRCRAARRAEQSHRRCSTPPSATRSSSSAPGTPRRSAPDTSAPCCTTSSSTSPRRCSSHATTAPAAAHVPTS